MDNLSTTFAALADPTRRAILARLATGDATVSELAEPFGLRLPTISKHLKVLERAALVSKSRRAQFRPCRLEATPLKEVAEWAWSYRSHWEESLDRLDEFLHAADPTPARHKRADAKGKGEAAPGQVARGRRNPGLGGKGK